MLFHAGVLDYPQVITPVHTPFCRAYFNTEAPSNKNSKGLPKTLPVSPDQPSLPGASTRPTELLAKVSHSCQERGAASLGVLGHFGAPQGTWSKKSLSTEQWLFVTSPDT